MSNALYLKELISLPKNRRPEYREKPGPKTAGPGRPKGEKAITPLQRQIMEAMEYDSWMTTGEVADLIGREPRNVSSVLACMAIKGLVESTRGTMYGHWKWKRVKPVPEVGP